MPIRHHAVRVPATTANLGPGFDAFGAAVNLHLYARSLPRSAQAERVVTAGEGSGELSVGDDNLVWRSLVAFCEQHELAVPDLTLRVVNEIPLERGLGSSSAAIVAGLALARAVTGVAVGDDDLCRLASTIEGHPDNVVPAVVGGLTASVVTDGGQLVVRRVAPSPRLRPLVLVPTGRQSTVAARAVLPASLGRAEVAHQAARATHVFGALAGLWPVDVRAAGDLLHEPSRLEVMGPTAAVVGGLRGAGVHAWLSGAGPAVAAVAGRGDASVVELAAALAQQHGFVLRALDWDLAGTIACPEDGCAVSGRGSCVHCPRSRI